MKLALLLLLLLQIQLLLLPPLPPSPPSSPLLLLLLLLLLLPLLLQSQLTWTVRSSTIPGQTTSTGVELTIQWQVGIHRESITCTPVPDYGELLVTGHHLFCTCIGAWVWAGRPCKVDQGMFVNMSLTVVETTRYVQFIDYLFQTEMKMSSEMKALI